MESRRMVDPLAQRTGTVDDAARLLLKMIAPLRKQGGFFQSETIVNVSSNFMVELDTPLDVQFEEIEFSSFCITFSNGKNCEIVNAQGDAGHGRVLDLGEIGSQASHQEPSLLYRCGEVKRFRDTVGSEELEPLKITEAALLEGDAPIYLNDVNAEIFPSTNVVPRPLKLDIQLQHENNAFISETIRVNINVTGSENKAFTLFHKQKRVKPIRYRESLSRTEFGIVSTGGTTTQKRSPLKYHYNVGEHQLRITFFANLPDDPTDSDKVNTTYSMTSIISISVPFVGDNNLRDEPSTKPPVPLLSSERLEPDFFDEICKAIFYTQIYQKTSVDLTIHNIVCTHID
ncbi:hypothetical protein QFC19_001044 [Naganishia cerealis]|uniref:Uncharacterized protein n=1 Tax=Naganishia cerealis TaxID=610337 RepID=A0ACC2WIW6_9TREE|nr:hypothetical protein QFC19_001044 [Naganishia cerealis]